MLSLEGVFNHTRGGILIEYEAIESPMTRVVQLAQVVPILRAPVTVGMSALRAYDHLARLDQDSVWGPDGERPYQLLQAAANAGVVAASFFRPQSALVLSYLSNCLENLKQAEEARQAPYEADQKKAWGFFYNAAFDLTLIALTCTVTPELILATQVAQMALTLFRTYGDVRDGISGNYGFGYSKAPVDLLLLGAIAMLAR